ncbi:WecB/TagA/CpsF family glycosyltransferase [Brevibacillus sp. B_LB10_24]|uniref:WecB/TagA/CpsF family glycosyltransferase n=1 Tax=Brevibacillus sp. B_LB10_24 TaxID=3380645 RepID=UPI0038B9B201
MKIRTVSVCGVNVQALKLQDLHSLIQTAVRSKEKYIIANHNLHSLYLYHKEPKMRDFYAKANYVHIDGMALVFIGRLLGKPLSRDHRVTYIDWTDPLMKEAEENGYRIFFLGSKPGVADKARRILAERYPGLQMEVAHGYFNAAAGSDECRQILDRIRAFSPHILMVGMGMPRQEEWILENFSEISANAILTAGACMDYVAGEVPTPPRWLGRIGLEWLYRLLSEPGRLWRRYLIEPWFIGKLLLKELIYRKNLKDKGLSS